MTDENIPRIFSDHLIRDIFENNVILLTVTENHQTERRVYDVFVAKDL